MASPFIEIPVGDRLVKVTNPDKVYFPETGATKRDLVEYYLSVADGIVRALRDRPTTLERWPAGVFPGAKLSTQQSHGGDAFFQKRVPKGAPEWVKTARIEFPSGRSADEVCPTEPAVVAWAANLGTLTFGRELERRLPSMVTTKWWKEERGENVFIDFNQNARDRTIASAYSVRPRPNATVSAPVSWDELADVDPEDFTITTMPARFAKVGDPHATIDDRVFSLDPLLEMSERDEQERGLGDMPYPPNYPKMPGEPMRVQPSKARANRPE